MLNQFIKVKISIINPCSEILYFVKDGLHKICQAAYPARPLQGEPYSSTGGGDNNQPKRVAKFLLRYKSTKTISRRPGSGRWSKITQEVKELVEAQMRLVRAEPSHNLPE